MKKWNNEAALLALRKLELRFPNGSPAVEDAKRELVERNYRLVWHLARRWHARYNPIHFAVEDFASEGVLGLYEAIRNWDPERKTATFATYASKAIWACMFREWKTKESIIRVPVNAKAKWAYVYSLDAPMAFGNNGEEVPFMDFIVDRDALEESQHLGEEGDVAKVVAAVDRLSRRQREAVRARFLKEEPLTLAAAGETMGICRERVRQLQNLGLDRLRDDLHA